MTNFLFGVALLVIIGWGLKSFERRAREFLVEYKRWADIDDGLNKNEEWASNERRNHVSPDDSLESLEWDAELLRTAISRKEAELEFFGGENARIEKQIDRLEEQMQELAQKVENVRKRV